MYNTIGTAGRVGTEAESAGTLPERRASEWDQDTTLRPWDN